MTRTFDDLLDALGPDSTRDPDVIAFTLAVAVSAVLDTPPLWGMLVGPPSSGKTSTFALLDRVKHVTVGDLTAPGLLSSITDEKGRRKIVGILPRAKREGGLILIPEFSTVLADSQRGRREQLFGMLRTAHDGSVERDLGRETEQIRWSGRVTALAAVTGAIDNYSAHADALGPRWVYLRLPQLDRAERRRRLRSARSSRGGLRQHAPLVAEIVDAARENVDAVSLPDGMLDAIEEAADFVGTARTGITRESTGSRDPIGFPEPEDPHRLREQLDTVARCALAFGLDSDASLALARRAAVDSMPRARRDVLAVLLAGGAPSISQVARAVGASRTPVRRALDDLEALEVVERSCWGDEKGDDAKRYTLTDRVTTESVYAGHPCSEMFVETLSLTKRTPTADTSEHGLTVLRSPEQADRNDATAPATDEPPDDDLVAFDPLRQT